MVHNLYHSAWTNGGQYNFYDFDAYFNTFERCFWTWFCHTRKFHDNYEHDQSNSDDIPEYLAFLAVQDWSSYARGHNNADDRVNDQSWFILHRQLYICNCGKLLVQLLQCLFHQCVDYYCQQMVSRPWACNSSITVNIGNANRLRCWVWYGCLLV